eukprot:m.77818 g.77818  ORF g.77818 m.77818 type:complete len:531 (-) comp12643_c0_seq2:2326-3918(-)
MLEAIFSLQFFVTVVVGLVTAAFAYHMKLSYVRSGEAPVVFSYTPILGHAIEFGQRPLQLLQGFSRKFADVFGMVVGGHRMFIISDPRDYYLILKANPRKLSISEFHNAVATNFLGASKASLEVINPSVARTMFSKFLLADNGLRAITERFQTHLDSVFTQWRKNEAGTLTLPMYTFLAKFIFRSSTASLFSEDIAEVNGLFEAFEEFDKFLPLGAAGVPIFGAAKSCRSKLHKALDSCASENVSEIIAARNAYFEELMHAGGMTNVDSAAMQLGMLWASAANTIPAVFWVLFLLLEHPAEFKKVSEEFTSVLEKKKKGESKYFTVEELESMKRLDSVISETLRLSSGSLVMRAALEDQEIKFSTGNTFKFRKGDRIGICPPLAHLDSDIFPNSGSFVPDRWQQAEDKAPDSHAGTRDIEMSKNGVKLNPANVFLPFGGGIAYCPGRRFARNEIKVLVATFLANVDMQLDESCESIKTKTHQEVDNQDMSASDKAYQKVMWPGVDGARAGLGIFPPKANLTFKLKIKTSK